MAERNPMYSSETRAARLIHSSVDPSVLLAVALARAVKPGVDPAEVVAHRVVGFALEAEVAVHLHAPTLVPRPDRLCTRGAAREVDLDVRHVVRLPAARRIKVPPRDEDEVPRLQMLRVVRRKGERVELVRLAARGASGRYGGAGRGASGEYGGAGRGASGEYGGRGLHKHLVPPADHKSCAGAVGEGLCSPRSARTTPRL
jgi:hypothetical protein